MIDRAGADGWVERYLEAWRTNDPEAVGALFAEDAVYLTGPFDDPWDGREAIVRSWLAHADEPGSWTYAHVATHVGEGSAFIEGRTDYPQQGTRFANLWQLELDAEGRATRFVEWWMQPRRSS